MRNVKAIRRLADYIERALYEFDMTESRAAPKCGTAGCIAGHAAVLWPSVRGRYDHDDLTFSWDDDALEARLGLTFQQAWDLFVNCPNEINDNIPLRDVDRRMAVRALRRFAATGKIEFRLGDREPKKVAA